ncbi:YceI family protein [Corticicoccus populi]|uniref:YceI family protein n=1 Tax=Corticicoccus populi TaxID=1812821 RepID=A0ABW5WUG5_9STAP
MTKFVADNAHSEVEFMVKHMMVTKVKGTFDDYSVEITADDIEDFENAKVFAKANVASINTGVADRDGHLRSGDFFETDTYPEITFESSNIEKSGTSYKVTGDLTIKDVTKEVTVELDYNGQAVDPMSGSTVYGFEGKFSLDREAYGLTWNQTLETGGVLVSKEVKISVELQFREA